MKVDSVVLLTAMTTQGVFMSTNHMYISFLHAMLKIVLLKFLIFQVSNCDSNVSRSLTW